MNSSKKALVRTFYLTCSFSHLELTVFYFKIQFADMLRSKNRGAPSNMKLFPEDIVRAEYLTHGNPAILQDDMFLPEEKPAYTDLFASGKKTPKKVKSDVKKKQTPVKQITPRLITHPRFLQLSSGQSTDYEVRERKQIPIRAECDVEDTSPPTTYSCTKCDYTTTRLNVIVWHNKSHLRNYASPQVSGKATKRKSTASVKLKERLSGGSLNVQTKFDDTETVSAAKIPKTNGTVKAVRSPKTPGRKKLSAAPQKTPSQKTPRTKETNSTSVARKPTRKGRRASAVKSDEIHKSLLEDWLEDEIDHEETAIDENSPAGDSVGENSALTDSSVMSHNSKHKSCFDFDDSEDHLVIDKSKFKPGRKIPRLLNKSASSTLAADDVVAMEDSTDDMEVDATTAESTPKYQSGVEDSMDGEASLCCSQTSQLQEMGVDNEIEIQTEETPVTKTVIESMPPKKSRRSLKTDVKANDTTELHNKVDKLLNEISKAPTKLPDIPRSHKKAQLKAYQQQAEAEEKAAAEAEAARKTAAEAEAAQKAAAETEAAQKAAAEAEATQKAAAEAEAAQMAAAQKAAAEKETAEKILAAQHKMEEQVAYDAHPEMMDIDVSNIPLPSPQKYPVTSEPVEISINIGASVTVADNDTVAEAYSSTSPSSEILVAKNAVTGNELVISETSLNSASVDQKTPAVSDPSSSHPPQSASVAGVADSSRTPATPDAQTPTKSTTPGMVKPTNPTQLLRSGQQKLKIISESEYKILMNKLSASASQVSPTKTSAEPLKTIKTTIKTASGKSFLCNLTQSPKMLLANSQSSNSPTKILILTNLKKSGTPSPATTATSATATTSSTPAGRSIDLATATTLRVTPNILQKSAAQKVAAAALAKSTGKNIVLDASTFQSLFQTQQQCKVQSQLVLPQAAAKPSSSAAISAAPTQSGIAPVAEGGAPAASSNNCAGAAISSTSGQTVDYNYIVDSSGNLIQIDESTATSSRDKDILAKALENTDGLQTEMALSDATNSVLDSCSVAQNTEMVYKADTIYENLTLNTAPIMSAYETPSRTAAVANVLAESCHEITLQGAAESGDFIS